MEVPLCEFDLFEVSWYILLQEPFYELFFSQNCIHLSEVTKRRSLISVRTHVLLTAKDFTINIHYKTNNWF